MKKDKQIHVRLSDYEYESIIGKSEKARSTLSKYVVMCCLGKQIFIVEGLNDLLKEHKAQGRNLNQLTRLAQSGAVKVVSMDETLAWYRKIYEQINDMYQRRRWR